MEESAAPNKPTGRNVSVPHSDCHPDIAGCPKRNPQSTQGPSVLESASIRSPLYVHGKPLQAFEPGTARAQERPQTLTLPR
eukprot:12630295-Alexandrium_andersonii.AAC.1